MLRNGGTAKISLSKFNAGSGTTSVRPLEGAEGARRNGASLSQLESVLQRLNKHDERAQIQSVERTSAQTQHKLLKDELLRAQEELVLVHTGKNKLCEQIGTLQQAKQDQQTQIEHLLVELRSSRESQAAMANKVAELERGSEDLKRNYIRSLTCRMKTASELLSRLHGGGAFDTISDVTKSIADNCEILVGSDPNKRKRIEVAQAVVADEIQIEDDPMTGQPSPEETTKAPSSAEEHTDVGNPGIVHVTVEEPADSNITEKEQQEGSPIPQVHQECQSCVDLALQNSTLKETVEKEVEIAKIELQKKQNRNDELVQMHEQAQAKLSTLNDMLGERDDVIADLKDALQVEKEKVVQAEETIQKSANTKVNSAEDDSSVRVKVLEDNLAQLNTYADHLEMLISQCASCSVKLQSENTQDSAK